MLRHGDAVRRPEYGGLPFSRRLAGEFYMTKEFDVVVVGSGFGGGTVALRAAQAGKSVCVLERGRRWKGKNLPPQPGDPEATNFPELGDKHFFWGRQLWRPTRQRLGLYEIRQFINLQGLVAAGVGGGSLIWANVVIEAPEHVFAANWPKNVNRASLDPYYRRADPFLRPAMVPGVPGIVEPAQGRTVKRAEALKTAADRLGRPWRPVRVAVNFGNEHTPQANGHGTARQLGCNYCGLCTAGCPQNAKNTVDITYVAAAESLGAEVRPLHHVVGVERLSSGRYRVHFRRFGLDGRLLEKSFVDGAQVALAAGAFGTTELLLKCRQTRFLPGLSEALGSRFSINGNVLSGALRKGVSGADVETNSGPAIASMVDFGSFAVEDFANPTWSAGIVGASNIGRITAFALAMAGYKPSPEAVARKARDLLVYVGVGEDSASGRLRLNRLGMLTLDWPGGLASEPVVSELHRAMARLAAAQGRQYVPNVFSIFNRLVTYHPLGGCPMADTPEGGVVDSFGQVYNYPGLYVVDGSIVPTAIGRNPSYTIVALAERAAEKMAEDSPR